MSVQYVELFKIFIYSRKQDFFKNTIKIRKQTNWPKVGPIYFTAYFMDGDHMRKFK